MRQLGHHGTGQESSERPLRDHLKLVTRVLDTKRRPFFERVRKNPVRIRPAVLLLETRVCGSKVLGLALEDTMVLGLGLRLDRWHLDGRVRARWHLGELRQAGC